MKEKIHEILMELNRGRIAVSEAQEQLLDLFGVSRSFVGLFMHYDNGDMVNIQDLPKPEYEKFLEQMNALRMAYIALVSRP